MTVSLFWSLRSANTKECISAQTWTMARSGGIGARTGSQKKRMRTMTTKDLISLMMTMARSGGNRADY